MPFPFSHIIFQSGAVFVVGFFLILYLENKFQDTEYLSKTSIPISPPSKGKLLDLFRFKLKSFPLLGEEAKERVFQIFGATLLLLASGSKQTTLNSSQITYNYTYVAS